MYPDPYKTETDEFLHSYMNVFKANIYSARKILLPNYTVTNHIIMIKESIGADLFFQDFSRTNLYF